MFISKYLHEHQDASKNASFFGKNVKIFERWGLRPQTTFGIRGRGLCPVSSA